MTRFVTSFTAIAAGGVDPVPNRDMIVLFAAAVGVVCLALAVGTWFQAKRQGAIPIRLHLDD